MSQLKVDFGKRLQYLRTQAGLSQYQVAVQVGVTVESISNMERGIHGPKFDTLEKLAQVLEVPVGALFEFD